MNLVEDSLEIREMFMAELQILERLYQKLYHTDLSIRIYAIRLFAHLSQDSSRPLVDSFLNEVFLNGLKHILEIGGSKSAMGLAVGCCANALCDSPEAYKMVLKHPITVKIFEIVATGVASIPIQDHVAQFLQNLASLCPVHLVINLLGLNLLEVFLIFIQQCITSANKLTRLMKVLRGFIGLGYDLEQEYGCNPVLNELNNRQELLHTVMTSISNRIHNKEASPVILVEYKELESMLSPLSQHQ